MIAHRYYRITFTSAVVVIQINELRFFAPNGAVYPQAGFSVQQGPGLQSSLAGLFDGDLVTGDAWTSHSGEFDSPRYLDVDMGSAVAISTVSIAPNQNADAYGWFATGFTVASSQTGAFAGEESPRLTVTGATSGWASYVLRPFTLFDPGVASAALAVPKPLLSAFTGAMAALPMPMPSLAAFSGARGKLSAPSAMLQADAHDSTGERSFTGYMPMATLSARGSAYALLTGPRIALSATGTVAATATAALVMPAPALSASGTTTSKASANLTLGSIGVSTYSLVGYSGAVLSVTLTGGYSVAATGMSGGIAFASLTLPLYSLTASASSQNRASASLLMPAARMAGSAQAWLAMPSATLTAIGTAVVSVSYEAYAVNLNHKSDTPTDEVTRYTNYPFDRIVRYKNSYYGMNSTGLYLLEGTTDMGAPVAWSWQTAETDFKSEQKKTVEMAYFGGRMAPASTISLYAGEGTANSYTYTTPRGALAQNYRQPFGRGIGARYFSLGVAGSGALDIDSVTFNVAILKRKV